MEKTEQEAVVSKQEEEEKKDVSVLPQNEEEGAGMKDNLMQLFN